MIVDKTVNLTLVGIDGNAFSIIGAFQKQARREGWTPEEIKSVIDEAMSSDYNHLLQTIMEHCENDGFGGDDEEDYEFEY